jgi:hypothetical protein
LYVVDDGKGDSGIIANGWTITITTTAAGPGLTISDPPDKSTNVTRATLAIQGRDEIGQVLLQITGLPWEKYVVEASDDLISWTPLGVAADETGVSFFTDVEAAITERRFYRVSNNP